MLRGPPKFDQQTGDPRPTQCCRNQGDRRNRRTLRFNKWISRFCLRTRDYTDGIANGPDEIRKAVRFEVKNGADVIKAAVSGGVLSLTDEVDTPQLTPTEMAALVDESHRLRKKVTVRCHGD